MAHLSQSDRALLRNILRALTDAGLDTIDVSSGTAAQKLIIARRGDISIDVNDKTLGWAARVFHRQGVFQMDEADRNALYPEPDQPPSTDEQSSSSTPELMTPDSTHHQDLLGVEQDRAGRDGEGATEGGGQGAPQPSPQASGNTSQGQGGRGGMGGNGQASTSRPDCLEIPYDDQHAVLEEMARILRGACFQLSLKHPELAMGQKWDCPRAIDLPTFVRNIEKTPTVLAKLNGNRDPDSPSFSSLKESVIKMRNAWAHSLRPTAKELEERFRDSRYVVALLGDHAATVDLGNLHKQVNGCLRSLRTAEASVAMKLEIGKENILDSQLALVLRGVALAEEAEDEKAVLREQAGAEINAASQPSVPGAVELESGETRHAAHQPADHLPSNDTRNVDPSQEQNILMLDESDIGATPAATDSSSSNDLLS